MNKSVRKKRQKDLAAAALKLRGLELGLNQMRLSASKPDVSTFECNGRRVVAKSCPTTPRGSIPDLCIDTDKSEYEDEEQVHRRQYSCATRSLHQRFSGASTSSNGSLGLPPRTSSCRSNTTRSMTSDDLDNPLYNAVATTEQTFIYENVGYRSTSYRSSYRQAHYPTLQDEHYLRKRALSAHSISQNDIPSTIPCNHRTIQFNKESKDSIPTADDFTSTSRNLLPEPSWRLSTSFSCQAGFSTASLDRKIGMQRPSTSLTSATLCHEAYSISKSRSHSPATHRITTFPVCNSIGGGFDRKPYSSSDLPRFRSPLNQPLSTIYNNSRGISQLNRVLGSTSAGKLPSKSDPHMEVLLEFYKGQSNQPSTPKTATIV